MLKATMAAVSRVHRFTNTRPDDHPYFNTRDHFRVAFAVMPARSATDFAVVLHASEWFFRSIKLAGAALAGHLTMTQRCCRPSIRCILESSNELQLDESSTKPATGAKAIST